MILVYIYIYTHRVVHQCLPNQFFVYMAPWVYLSPEFACFLGPVPVVTKMPSRGHAIPTAGVGPPKRASLLSVEGALAYLMDLM